MSELTTLRVTGDIERPLELAFEELAGLPAQHQVPDMSQIDPKRRGAAVRLAGLLELANSEEGVRYIGLHASADDFHASIPLEAVRDSAVLIYELDGHPLPAAAGGPVRFFIPDHAACHTHEIDECANVKFVDWIELTRDKGRDNRPQDESEHARLHQK